MTLGSLLLLVGAASSQAVIPPAQGGPRRPSCPPEPCVEIEGRKVIHVGWFVDGQPEALEKLRSVLKTRLWDVSKEWKVGDHYRARIMSDGKTAEELLSLDQELRQGRFGAVKSEMLTLPLLDTAK